MSSRFKVRSGATTPRDRTEDDSLLTQGDVTSSITSSVPPVAAAAQHSGRGLQSSLGHSGFSQSSSVRIHSVPHTSITAIPLAGGHASRHARATTAASSTAAATAGNTASPGPNTTGNTAAEVGGGGGGSRQSSRATTPSHSRPVSPSPALSARGKPTPLPERPSRPETPSPSEAAEIFDAHVKGADDKKPPTVSPTTHTLDQESPAPNTESETKDDTTSMAQTLISDRSPHTPPSHRRESRTPPASRVPGRRAAAPRTPALPSMRHLRSNSASTAASHLGASHLGASYLGTPRVGVPATKVSPSDKSARPPVPPMSRAMSRMGSPRVQERGASFAVGSDSSANVSPSVSPGSRSRPLIPNVFLPADADDSSKDDKHETLSHQDDPHSQQHDGSQSHRLSDSRREKEKERDRVTPTIAAAHRDSRASRHFSDATLDDDDDRQRRRSAAQTAPQNASEGDLIPSTSVGSIGRTGPQSTARPEDIRSRSHGSSSSKSPDRDHRQPSVSAGDHDQSRNRDRKGERRDQRSGGSHSPGSPGHGRHSGPRRRSAASTISGAAAVPLGDLAAESSSAFHVPTDDDSPHQTAGKDSVLSSLLPSRRRGGGGGHTFPAAPGHATTRGDRGENESAEVQPALGSVVALDSGRFAAQGSGSFRRPSMNPSASSSSYFESAPTSGLRRERPTHLTVPANTVPVHDHASHHHKDRLGVASVAGVSGVSGSKDYRSSSSRLNSPPALRPAMPGSHSREPSRGAESTSASMAASPATPASRGLGASDRSVMSRHSSVPSNYASATGAAALDSGASQARSEREGQSHHSYSHSQSQGHSQSQSQSLSRSNIRLPTSTSPGNRHEEGGDDDDGMLSALLPSSYKPTTSAQPSSRRHQDDSLAGTQNTQASARTSGQNKLLGSRSFLAAAAAATPLTTMSSDRNQTVLSGLTSPRSDDPLAADFVSLNTTAVRSSQPPLDQFQQQQFHQPQPHQHRTGRTDEHLSATVTSASVSANSASGDGHPAALRESMRGRSILGLVDTPLTTNRPNGSLPARGGVGAQHGPGVSAEENDRTADVQQHHMGGRGTRSPQTRIYPPAFDTDTDDDMARRSLPGSPSQPLMTHPLGLRVHSPTKLFSSADISAEAIAHGHQESRVVALHQNGGLKSSAVGQEGDQEFSVVEVCFAVPALSYSRYLTTRPAAIAKGVASDIEHECGPLLDVESKNTESPTAQTAKSPTDQFAEHYDEDEDEDDAIASMFMTASQLQKCQISHSDRLHDNGGRGRDRGAGAGDRKLKEEADSTPPIQPPLSTVRAKIESAAAVFSVDQMEAWLRLREEGVTAAVRRYAGADLENDAASTVDRRDGAAADRDHNPHKHHHQRPQEEVIDEAVLDVVDEVVATKTELIDWVAVVAYITCPASSRDAIAAHLRELLEDASKENAVALKSYIQSSDTLSSLLRSQRRGSNAGFHDVSTVASTPAPILPSLRQMAGLQRPDATVAPSLWRVDGVGPVEEFHELERIRHVRAKQGQRLLREKVKALEEREAAQTNNNASAAVHHRIAHEPHGRHDNGESTKKQNDSRRADDTNSVRGRTTFDDRDHHVDANRHGHHHHARRAEKSPDRRVQVASSKPPVHSSMHSGPSSVRDTPMRGPTSMSKESQPTPSRELLSLMDQLRPRRRSSTSADRSPDHRPNDSVSARPARLNRDSASADNSSSAGQLSNDFASRPTREHRDADIARTRRVDAVMNGSSNASSVHSRHHAGAATGGDGVGARVAAGAFRGAHRDPTSEEVAPRGASPQPHSRRCHMADAEADAKGVGLPSPFPPSQSPLPPARRQESPSRTSFNENAGDNAGKPQPAESSKSKEGPSALGERQRRPQDSMHDASVNTNATSSSVAASADGLIAVQLETMLTEIDGDLFTKQGTIDADFTATAHKTACRDLFDACGSGAVNRPSDVGVRLSSVPFHSAKRKTKTSKTATITDDFSFDPVTTADGQRGSKQNAEEAGKENDAEVVNVVNVTAVLECEPRFKTAMVESVTKQLKSDDAFIKLKLLCVHQLDCEFVYGVDAAHTVLDGRTLE